MQVARDGFKQKKRGVEKIRRRPNKTRQDSSLPEARIIAVFQ